MGWAQLTQGEWTDGAGAQGTFSRCGHGPQAAQPGVERPIASAGAATEEVAVSMTDLIHSLVHPADTAQGHVSVPGQRPGIHRRSRQTGTCSPACQSSVGTLFFLKSHKAVTDTGRGRCEPAKEEPQAVTL